MLNFTIPNATNANTGKPLTVSCSPMPGTNFTKNSTVVNCTASDAEGHVASQVCSFNVQICKKNNYSKNLLELKFVLLPNIITNDSIWHAVNGMYYKFKVQDQPYL